MVPEIKYFVPTDKLEDFKWRVAGLTSARLISTRTVKEDKSPDQQGYPELDDLAEKMRRVLSRLPKDTLLKNLTYSQAKTHRRNLQTPPEWLSFMASNEPSDKNRITRAFRTLSRIAFNQRSLEELSQLNWDQIELLGLQGMGQRGEYLVRKTFEGLTFSDRYNLPHGTRI